MNNNLDILVGKYVCMYLNEKDEIIREIYDSSASACDRTSKINKNSPSIRALCWYAKNEEDIKASDKDSEDFLNRRRTQI